MHRSSSTSFVTAVTFTLLCTLSASLPAQQVGLLVGGTFSQLHGLNGVNSENRTGTLFGGALTLPFGRTWSVQPEVLFTNKGSKFNTGGGGQTNVRLDYLDIPVLLRYDVAGGTTLSPHLYAGPAVSYRVGCNVKVSGSGIPNTSSDCGRNNFDLKTFDWGAVVGGGVDLSLGGFGVTGGARYGVGFADINNANTPTLSQRIHNGTFAVYAGLLFGHR